MLYDAMRRVKAHDGCGRDESQGDEEFQPGRPQDGEHKLADAECDTGASGADDDSAEQAGAGLMRPDARADADESWESKDSEREQSQQSTPMAASEPRMAKMIMVVASVRIGLTGAPITTTKAESKV